MASSQCLVAHVVWTVCFLRRAALVGRDEDPLWPGGTLLIDIGGGAVLGATCDAIATLLFPVGAHRLPLLLAAIGAPCDVAYHCPCGVALHPRVLAPAR